MTARSRTDAAFTDYRTGRHPKQMHPDASRYTNDTKQMMSTDGLEHWVDGSASEMFGPAPLIDASPPDRRLWAVTSTSVFHAPEMCQFANSLGAGAVKHSNLTGGGDAHSGGELVFLSDSTIVINGSSGRYRISTKEEMEAIETAFTKSGYLVWSMGFDSDVNRPRPFGTIKAQRVTV